MQKRYAFKLAFAGAAALMLAACGKEEPKTAAPQKAADAAQPAAAAPASTGPLKVAFVYVSPANEEGWSTQHDIARKPSSATSFR